MSGWEWTPTDTSDVPSLAQTTGLGMPPTLVGFILARVADLEALARAAMGKDETDADGHWEIVEFAYEGCAPWPRGSLAASDIGGGYDPGYPWTDLVNHFDPARVLAECEAKRRIVERFAWAAEDPDLYRNDMELMDQWQAAWDTLADAATIHADHPDYDESWRP